MTENVLTRMKSYMQSQSFSVDDSWLRDCIEYYMSEDAQASYDSIQKFVRAQYLLSDLREVNTTKGCLPANLVQQKCTTLNGKYTLQLLKIYDISVSKFKQLEKIRNVSIDNIEATKEEKPQPWEPTGKRMLKLFLTDGMQEISAIEYKTIRILHDALYPGHKIMIIGPVICRRGIIMLEETNISLKGGEVEDLLIPNALENVLAKALKLSVNPDPYNDRKKENEKKPDHFEDDFNITLEELEQIERSEVVTERKQMDSNKNPLQSTNTHSNAPPKINNGQNDRNSRPTSNQQNKISNNFQEFPEDDDLLFEDLDIDDAYASDFKVPVETKSKTPEPKPSTSSNALEFPDDDFDLGDLDFDSGISWSEPKPAIENLDNKNLNNLNNKNLVKKEPVTSFRKESSHKEFSSEELMTGNKRPSGQLSPLPTSQAKIRCAQSTPKMSKVNRKITDFIGNKSIQDSLPPKICDYISDVLALTLTNSPIRKTVRGKVPAIGNLTKKNMLWILDGTINDQTGSLDVDFSSQFMENLLGMTVSEFSQRKKQSKSNPQMTEQLRKQLVGGQNKLQAMDCLFELELKKDAKPVVLSYTELTQEQLNAQNKRFKMLKGV